MYCDDEDFIRNIERVLDRFLDELHMSLKLTCKCFSKFKEFVEYCSKPYINTELKEDFLILEIELPGVDKDKIKLWLDEDKDRLHLEAVGDKRRYCATYRLPYRVEPDDIDAEYKNGLLVVKIRRRIKAGYEIKIK